MSQVEEEFQEYDENRLWMEVYRRIKNEATLTTMDDAFSVGEARSPRNRSKNRYRDVSPYDHSRVTLEKEDSEEDYINASFVEVPGASRKYILAQGPLEHTAGDFWLMVWQQKSRAVVMLNRVIEKGTVKCAQYWPLGSAAGYEDDMIFEDVSLRVTLTGEEESSNFTTRWLQIEDMATGDKREVLHFHYTTWPDFGVPTSATAFLNFLNVVREAGGLDSSYGPAVIHCSAGIGRSGTFCLADSCLVMIEKHGTLACIDIRKLLIEMRSYRMGLIQTPDQLRFTYLTVIQGGRGLLGHDANSNVKLPDDEAPPPPPARVTSLPVYSRQNASVSSDDDEDENGNMDDVDDELAALIDDDDERPPPLPPKSGSGSPVETDQFLDKTDAGEEAEEEKSYQLRRRIREERIKNTQEKIRTMKERQRKSEAWKRRRSYLPPLAIGLAIIVGSYMFYRFYWRY